MDKKVVDFLIRAKKATYAGKGSEIYSSRPNSHDLEYSEGDLKYLDTYLGGKKFSGEEALWKNEKPFWAMNYMGRVLDKKFESDFLKEALSNIPKNKPFRGLEEYKKDHFKYICKINGEFNWFDGIEEIFYDDIKIYECIFHGGEVI